MFKFRNILFSLLSISSPALPDILVVDDLCRFEEEVEKLNEDALVLFDVDDTLIVPKDAILRPCGRAFVKKFTQMLPSGQQDQEELLFSKVLLQKESILVDPKAPDLIKSLHARKIPTIALTAADSGKLGHIENMADWRIHELKSLDLDFTPAFPHHELMEFPTQKEMCSNPTFKGGILFTSDHPKGDILKAFLEKLSWRPKKVLFIDDKLSYIESVETTMKELGIECISFHYSAAEKLPCQLDEEIAKIQVTYLMKHGQWLSDTKAAQLRMSF